MAPGAGAIGIEIPVVLAVEVVHPARAAVKVIEGAFVVVVVVTVAVMVAAVIVTAVPSRIPIEVIVVVNYRTAAPVTIPGVPSPSATTAACKSTDGDSCAESDHSGSCDISRGVSRGNVWIAVD